MLRATVGDGHDFHRTGFGATAVEPARIAVAVESGDVEEAVARHEKVTTREGWRWLVAAHRAAYLVDVARAYLHADDPVDAGRVLMEADRIAPAEIRQRPAGRDILARIARDPAAPTTLTHLAATLGVSCGRPHHSLPSCAVDREGHRVTRSPSVLLAELLFG